MSGMMKTMQSPAKHFARNGLKLANHDSIAPHNGAEREFKKGI